MKPIIKKKNNDFDSKQSKKKKKKNGYGENYLNNRTITIKQGRIAHDLTSNILGDPKYGDENNVSGYMEDYFLDERSQLEKRIAIGDSSYLEHLKGDDKVLMKKMIKDIQSQLLTHN